jgi:hypothetical protein
MWLKRHGIVLVVIVQQRLKPQHVGGTGNPDDALAAIRQELNQLQRAGAHGKHVVAGVARVVKGRTGFDVVLVDGLVDALKGGLIEASEEHRGPQ